MNISYDVSYDKAFDKIRQIRFYPFIGNEFYNTNPKILVLGESLYFAEEDRGNEDKINNDKDINRKLVLGDCEENYKPYSNTIAMLTNRVIENKFIYDKIAFYNFFQKRVGYGSSDKSLIDANLIDFSREAYFSLIKIIKPNLIIAWGVRNLYYNWVPQENCEIISDDNMLYRYNHIGDTYIWHIKHPSSPMFDLFEATNNFSNICKKLNYKYPFV